MNKHITLFTVKFTSLYEISAIIPSFVNMTDESKFKFMCTYSEYVIRVIVKGINDMYNARNEVLNNKYFLEMM